ncbi:Uncharacterised protein [Bordetella pertussis]|nr:Uncharacterised protein [Bordetella pertussis]
MAPMSMPACDSRVVAWPRWWVWWLKKCRTRPPNGRRAASQARLVYASSQARSSGRNCAAQSTMHRSSQARCAASGPSAG